MLKFYRDEFEHIRPQAKAKLQHLLNQFGITGVLEILSEIAEESAGAPHCSPKFVALWNTAAAGTKQLSEELFQTGIKPE